MGELILKNKGAVLRDGFKMVRGSKICFNIIPDSMIENGLKMEGLALTVYEIYRTAFQRLEIGWNGVKFKLKENLSYEIYMEKDLIKFMFIVPEEFRGLIINKIENTWPKATITQIQDFNYKFNYDHTSYTSMIQKEPFFKSLKCDLRGADPLPSILGVSNSLEAGDALLLQYIFEPIPDIWKDKAIRFYKDHRKGIEHDKNLSITGSIFKFVFKLVDDFFNMFDIFFKIDHKAAAEKTPQQLRALSNASIQKVKYDAFKTAIRIVCSCEDPRRRESIIKNTAIALREMNGDNELVDTGIKKVNRTILNYFKPGENFIKKVIERRSDLLNNNIYSVREAAQFMQMPTPALQNDFKQIKSIDVREINVPLILRGSGIPIGSTTHKGKEIYATWPTDYDIITLPKVIIGPMGSGKTKYIIRFIKEAQQRNQAVLLFDYVKNNEVTAEVLQNSKDLKKVIVLDMADLDNPVRLSYDEIVYTDNNRSKLQCANMQAEMIAYLLNSIKEETTPALSGRMLRYLYAAAMVTYTNKDKGLEDLQSVLFNHRTRAEFIKIALESGLFNKNSIEILDLQSLDETDAKGKVKGTTESKIDGLADRFSILNRNIYLKFMLSGSNKINLVELLDQKYTIIVKIPEAKFPGPSVKDTIVTFFMSKLRLATLIRGEKTAKPGLVHVICDEVHKIETAAKFTAQYIDEVRKYGVDYVFTIHYLKQFKALLDPIKSAGVSYIIMAGTEKDNLQQLQEEIQPFTIEEALKLKRWSSLNIINTGGHSSVFTSNLPKLL